MKNFYDIIIIGAGPAGTSLSIMLRKYGYDVAIFEQGEFPKHNIGESLLPIVTSNYMKAIGLDKKIEEQNFPKKYGTTFVWGNKKDAWSLLFDKNLDADKTSYSEGETEKILDGDYVHSYQVNRFVFDQLFVEKALGDGVNIYMNKKVQDIYMVDNEVKGIILDKDTIIKSYFVVDASGQSSLIGTKFGIRKFNEDLGFSATYCYFKNINFLDNLLTKHTQYIVSIDIGWVWFIYIGNGIVSVGLVTNQKAVSKEEFLVILHTNDALNFFFTEDTIMTDSLGKKIEKLYRARNWSYFSDYLYGRNFLLIGDSAGFVDPILSGGLSLALMSGVTSAPYIDNFLKKGDISIFKKYQEMVFRDIDNYYQLAKHWYGNNNSQASWFWDAKKILAYDIDNKFNKRAFTFIASGNIYTQKNLEDANELRINNYAYDFEDINEIHHIIDNKDIDLFTIKELLFAINSDISNDYFIKNIKKILLYLNKIIFLISKKDLELGIALKILLLQSHKMRFLGFIFDIKNSKYIEDILFEKNLKSIILFKQNIFYYFIFLIKQNEIKKFNIEITTILKNNYKLNNGIEIQFFGNISGKEESKIFLSEEKVYTKTMNNIQRDFHIIHDYTL